MVVEAMIRNNVCMNAHPTGCDRYVQEQIDYVKSAGPISGPVHALVIGSSAGYGLSSRIVAAFGAGAGTIGVAFETPAKGSRTASVGWYNDRAFLQAVDAWEPDGSGAGKHRTFLGDAFSHAMKRDVMAAIKEMFGTVDLVVYSLASGLRFDPDTGERYTSVLKPLERPYSSITLDGKTGTLVEASIEPATEEEAAATVKVMGGEDWELWIRALQEAGVLADGAKTVAYSYIGPEITFPLYRDGTIGRAKEHLEATAGKLTGMLAPQHGVAYVSVNKALVTRASSVIPAVPLYLAILYRVMKKKGIHEETIQQAYRLFGERLYTGGAPLLDGDGRIRIDDWEMRADVQSEVLEAWNKVTPDNVGTLADIHGFQQAFLNIHGFGFEEIDYTVDVEV